MDGAVVCAVRMVACEERVGLCEVLVGLCEARMVEREERVVERVACRVERVIRVVKHDVFVLIGCNTSAALFRLSNKFLLPFLDFLFFFILHHTPVVY